MVRKNAINKYKLPVPKHRLQRIDKTSSPAHVGKLRNAIDFIVDEETPVLAEPSAGARTSACPFLDNIL